MTLRTSNQLFDAYFTAGSMAEARKSVFVSGMLNFVSVALLALLGVLFWAYYHSSGRDAPDDDHAGDRILLTFAADALPPGVLGLLVAAVLGSTMAVFSGGVNAAARHVTRTVM